MHLVLQALNLRVRIVDRPVEADVQASVLLGQGLAEVLLVVDILRSLVGPEAQGAACALHNDVGAHAAEDARLVVLAGAEVGDDGVVRVVELAVACRAGVVPRRLVACADKSMGTFKTEDMAWRYVSCRLGMLGHRETLTCTSSPKRDRPTGSCISDCCR